MKAALVLAASLGAVIAAACGTNDPDPASGMGRPAAAASARTEAPAYPEEDPGITAPARASSGETIAIRIRASSDYLWGLDAYLERADSDGKWTRVALLWTDPKEPVNESVVFEDGAAPERLGIRSLGLRGDATVSVRLPSNVTGNLRIAKQFVRQEGAEAETLVRTVSIVVTE